MRAIEISAPGGPEVLRLVERPMPVPGPGDVLVRVEAAGSQVRSKGPKEWMQQKWSVSYEVFVPQKSDLTLETTNGGISVADVRGAIAAETTNGGLRLARLAGTVKAETTNGGVNIELSGRTWDGESLHVETTNGGVNLEVPSAYAARIEAKTTNGGLNSDLPAQVTGKSPRVGHCCGRKSRRRDQGGW